MTEFGHWIAIENEFHGVCGTIRGRLLHPQACTMGMTESIFLAGAVLQVIIHWGPHILLSIIVRDHV